MSIILQGFGKYKGLITQGYDIAADAIYPPANAVAAGVVYGPNGSRLGTMTYAGFVATGDAPSVPPNRRRTTPSRILDKRPADVRLFDIDLTYLLGDAEMILYVRSIVPDDNLIRFGAALINPCPIYYKLLDEWAAIGKVVQVQIHGGELSVGTPEKLILCRMVVATNENPAIEAPFTLRLINSAP